MPFLRMPPQMFDELLKRVGPRCHKMETHYMIPLEPGLKVAITILKYSVNTNLLGTLSAEKLEKLTENSSNK